jgi:hypothetical protein
MACGDRMSIPIRYRVSRISCPIATTGVRNTADAVMIFIIQVVSVTPQIAAGTIKAYTASSAAGRAHG